MPNKDRIRFSRILAISAIALFLGGTATPFDDLGQRASWTSPTASQAKAEIDNWLADQSLSESEVAEVEAIWQESDSLKSGQDLLDAYIATITIADERTRPIALLCQGRREFISTPEFDLLAEESVAPLVRNNLRLYYGGWLTQQHLFDEALVVLDGLEPSQVVDPESLLFYLSASHHFLIHKEEGLRVIAQLLEREDELSLRYRSMAQLMQADLARLEFDSLDEVSRLMTDIERRLALGRMGTRVRGEEEDVIAKLDKMIEELEEAASSSSSSASGQGQPSSAAPPADAYSGGASGEGEINPANIGDAQGWGNLPPSERQEALQQISKEFPSHYREVIEEYFRRLARDQSE